MPCCAVPYRRISFISGGLAAGKGGGDGVVAAVPTANQDICHDVARKTAALFREHGARRAVETWGDDLPEGRVTSFPMAGQQKEDETVVFSWIIWPSKAVRDDRWQKMMQDPRMAQAGKMPFDGNA